LLAQAERDWRHRGQERRLRHAIEAWEQALALDDNDAQTWTRLSRALYFLADAHLLRESTGLEEVESEESLRTLDRGRKAAEKALSVLAPGLEPRMGDGARFRQAISGLSEDSVPALYWRSVHLEEWAAFRGYAESLLYKDEIDAAMAFCLAKSDGYYHGGPHRYFGTLRARPLFYGDRNLTKSREHFERSLSMAPDFLENRLRYARDYAVMAQDQNTFEAQLRHVLEADPNAVPEIASENRIQQRKAEQLLQQASELFE
jgi:hypothetical protein